VHRLRELYSDRIVVVRGGIQVYEDGFPTEQFTKPYVGTDEFIG
jgi:hypothetical protein